MSKFMQNSAVPVRPDLSLLALSLEGVTMDESTLIFRNVLPDMVNQFKTLSQGLVSSFVQLFTTAEKRVITALPQMNYMHLANDIIIVPEGFSGDLYRYLQTLLKLQNPVYSKATQVLQEYHVIVSSFLTNKEDQTSAKDQTGFYRGVERSAKEVNEEIASFFQAPNNAARAKFGQVISRLTDVPELIKTAEKLENSHNVANLKNIDLELIKITTMLDLIISRMQSESIDKVSPASARNLAHGAYEVARYIEMASVFHFKTTVAIKTVDELISMMNKKI